MCQRDNNPTIEQATAEGHQHVYLGTGLRASMVKIHFNMTHSTQYGISFFDDLVYDLYYAQQYQRRFFVKAKDKTQAIGKNV